MNKKSAYKVYKTEIIIIITAFITFLATSAGIYA